jgi:hypothetical protein
MEASSGDGMDSLHDQDAQEPAVRPASNIPAKTRKNKKDYQPLEGKIFKWNVRKPFLEMAKKYGKGKFTILAVWNYMFWRSGKGDLFTLAEELVCFDLGIDPGTYGKVKTILINEGWMKKGDLVRLEGGKFPVRTYHMLTKTDVEKSGKKAKKGDAATHAFTTGGDTTGGTAMHGKPSNTVALQFQEHYSSSSVTDSGFLGSEIGSSSADAEVRVVASELRSESQTRRSEAGHEQLQEQNQRQPVPPVGGTPDLQVQEPHDPIEEWVARTIKPEPPARSEEAPAYGSKETPARPKAPPTPAPNPARLLPPEVGIGSAKATEWEALEFAKFVRPDWVNHADALPDIYRMMVAVYDNGDGVVPDMQMLVQIYDWNKYHKPIKYQFEDRLFQMAIALESKHQNGVMVQFLNHDATNCRHCCPTKFKDLFYLPWERIRQTWEDHRTQLDSGNCECQFCECWKIHIESRSFGAAKPKPYVPQPVDDQPEEVPVGKGFDTEIED